MSDQEKKKRVNKRHASRIYAMQALYQWHFTQQNPADLTEDFIYDFPVSDSGADVPFFRQLLGGALEKQEELDALISQCMTRKLALLNPVELAILRLAVYELSCHKEVPAPVVMNEAIELAKEYGAKDGYKFVNGVLNAVIKKL